MKQIKEKNITLEKEHLAQDYQNKLETMSNQDLHKLALEKNLIGRFSRYRKTDLVEFLVDDMLMDLPTASIKVSTTIITADMHG